MLLISNATLHFSDFKKEKTYIRTVAMRKGSDGFGFTLNGIPSKIFFDSSDGKSI